MTFAGDSGLLISAWAMGFLGSTHCVGMCGGISAALSFALPAEARKGARLFGYQLAYNSGRIGTYTLLGALLGWLGGSLLGDWAMTLWPRLVAAVVMIALGLYLAGWWHGLQKLERMGGGVWKYLQPLSRRLLPVDNPLKAIVAGAVWGFLPCGLVYSGLGLALTAAHTGTSALVMLAFGLGTLPTLLVTGSLAAGLRRFMQAPQTRQVAGAVVIGFGVWTAAMALYHHGHHHMAGMSMPGDDMPAHMDMPMDQPATPAASAMPAMDMSHDDMQGMDMSGMSAEDMAKMHGEMAAPGTHSAH
jgi:sulfite exporter TauE/SafE